MQANWFDNPTWTMFGDGARATVRADETLAVLTARADGSFSVTVWVEEISTSADVEGAAGLEAAMLEAVDLANELVGEIFANAERWHAEMAAFDGLEAA